MGLICGIRILDAPAYVRLRFQLCHRLIPRLNVSSQDAVRRFGVTATFNTMYTVNRRAISSGVILAMWRLIKRRLRVSLSEWIMEHPPNNCPNHTPVLASRQFFCISDEVSKLGARWPRLRPGASSSRNAFLLLASSFATFISGFKGARMPVLILRMGFAEPFPALRAVHSGRDEVASVAFGRDSLTRALRGSEVGILPRHTGGVVLGFQHMIPNGVAH